jgi:crotonobetainyl-CoA:carnitine CoA-transferase CaiB-like acyl-CoA transferase
VTLPITADVAEIAAAGPGGPIRSDHVQVTGGPCAASAFDVDRLLATTAGYAVAGIDAATDDDDAAPGVPSRTIELEHLLAFCTTHLAIDGAEVPAWADLSGVYPTADGRHLQIHCNFEHHAAGVTRLLGTSDDRDAVAGAIATRHAFELETELVDVGMIGAAVRTLDEWDLHPHAAATRGLPLMSVEQIGDADPLPSTAWSRTRVLDCSRVLAGPVAGQMLANAGADVVRLGAPHLPSVAVGVISTGFGKRNAFADLRTERGRSDMTALIEGADIWIDAYRPGALASFGFTPERVAALRPGIVMVQISAFDWSGPWAGRRGFDSIIQSTTGVRWAGGSAAIDADGSPATVGPTGLPVQALDYATGFLGAGVAGQLLRHQRRVGGSWLARLSLLRTRNHLVGLGGPTPYVPAAVPVEDRHLVTVDSAFGRVTAVAPFAGSWQHAPRELGTDEPAWRTD